MHQMGRKVHQCQKELDSGCWGGVTLIGKEWDRMKAVTPASVFSRIPIRHCTRRRQV